MNENPVLLDKVLGQLQTALEANVSWLTHAYGKTQRIVKRIQGRDYYMPAIYTGDTEYLSMLPDARLGNFSFFDIPDAYRFPEYNRFAPNKFFTPFRLVVWFDERTIWGPGMSNREQLKMDVLAVLGQVTLSDGGLWVEKVYERHENIYRGYSLRGGHAIPDGALRGLRRRRRTGTVGRMRACRCHRPTLRQPRTRTQGFGGAAAPGSAKNNLNH